MQKLCIEISHISTYFISHILHLNSPVKAALHAEAEEVTLFWGGGGCLAGKLVEV